MRIIPDLSTDTLNGRSVWTNVGPSLRDYRFQLRLLYPAQSSVTLRGENTLLDDKI
ncbi:rCG36963, partial [Rattus norvegicus]